MHHKLRVAVRRFDAFEQAIAEQFEDFARATSVDAEIEIVAMDLNPLHETLIGRRGLAGPDWDVAFLSTDWIAEVQALGLAEDLRPWQARLPIPDFPDAWSPSLLGLQSVAGGLWGMPYHDGPQCLIFRRDLLDAAGLDVPATWDAFHAAARRLHDPANGVSGTVLAMFPDGHNGFYDFCIHLWTRGGAPFDETGRPQFTTPPAIAALDFIRALAADDAAIAPNPATIDSVASGLMFCEGRVALMTNWFGFAALGETWADSRVAGKIGIAPLPVSPGLPPVSLNVYWVLAIAAGSRQKALAWDFLRHCATAPMDRLTTLRGAIGVRRSTWNDPEVNAAVPYYHELEALHACARELPSHPRLSEVASIVDAMIGSALSSSRPSAELLAEAQVRVAALIG